MRPVASRKSAAPAIHQTNPSRQGLMMGFAVALNALFLGYAAMPPVSAPSIAPAAPVVAQAPARVVAPVVKAPAAPAPVVAAVAPKAPAPAKAAVKDSAAPVNVALKQAVQKASKPIVTAAKAKAKGVALAELSERQLLARVVWHEARGQGRLGMVATGIITLNRLNERHNGHATLKSVVSEPFAYTWVKDPQKEQFKADSLSGQAALQVADRLLSGQLLGDEQALADKLGKANHFHAVTMARYPSWAFSPKLARVKLLHSEEVALGAVFYAPREDSVDVASR